jgi:uncharacterized protein (DUF924 family)
MAATPNEIVDFWIEEVGPDGWYSVDPEIDKQIIERFGADREAAKEGRLDDWQQTALGSLALLILLDQFSRNMFRGDAEAFAEDEKAVAVARIAIVKDQDQEIPPPAQQFFYLPFMHSEDLAVMDYGIGMLGTRTKLDDTLFHMKAHRRVIERYGRFPHRNEALGRESSDAEKDYIESGGYMKIVKDMEAEKAG